MQTGEDEVLCRKVCNLTVDFLYPLLTACCAVLQFLKLPYECAEQVFSVDTQLSYHKVKGSVHLILFDSAPSTICLVGCFCCT